MICSTLLYNIMVPLFSIGRAILQSTTSCSWYFLHFFQIVNIINHFISQSCYFAAVSVNIHNKAVVDVYHLFISARREPSCHTTMKSVWFLADFTTTVTFCFTRRYSGFWNLFSSVSIGTFSSLGFQYSTSTQICLTICSPASFMFFPNVSLYLFWWCPLQVPSSKKRSTTVIVNAFSRANDKIDPFTHSFSSSSGMNPKNTSYTHDEWGFWNRFSVS